jgi:SAM-dependent methyltransferase
VSEAFEAPVTADFEARYQADPDPWRTQTDPYEAHKRERTLAACGDGPFAFACDLGAGTGLLAAALAPRCQRLLALDGAPTAVAAAQQRLTPFPHAEARAATLPEDLPTGPLDLVVASEILYYLDDAAFHTVLDWLPRALTPSTGRIVAVHWTGTAPDLRRGGAARGPPRPPPARPRPAGGGPAAGAPALAATPGLRVIDHGVTKDDGFRLDLLERTR